MKRTMLTILMAVAVTAAIGQTYSVRPEHRPPTMMTDTLKTDSHVFKAGIALRKSAYYDVASWVLTAASGVAYAGLGNADRKACNAIGTVLAVMAVASKVVSVSMKDKAGRELMLAPGRVTVTF